MPPVAAFDVDVPAEWRDKVNILLQIWQKKQRQRGRNSSILGAISLFDGRPRDWRLSACLQQAGVPCVSIDVRNSLDQDILSETGRDYSLGCLMKLAPNSLLWMAPECSTWIWLNRVHNQRSLDRPQGELTSSSVHQANQTAAFVARALKLATSRGQVLGVRLVPRPLLGFPDSWHVLQNSLINAAKENQMMGMLRLTTTAMDAVFGPWSSQRWFETIIEGAAEALVFLRGPEAEDGLKRIRRSLLPRIAVERGWTEFDDHEELALQALAESRFVRVKGERSQITRWFAWHRHFESWIGEASGHEDFPGQYQGEWTLRLIPLLLIGLSMGFVRADDSGDRQVVKELSTRAAATAAGQAAAATAADTAAADASAAAGSSSTSREKTAEQKLRDSCKNILHIATCIHGDRFLYSEALMFLYACRPLRDWYSHHRHNLRSQKACLQFYKDMAAGRCLEHVGKIGSLSQMELGKIGIFTEEILSSKSLQNLDIYDLEVRVQDNLAESLGGLVLSLQKFRLHGLVMYTHAFPYCIVGLLDEDPAANRLVQIFTRSKP